MTTAQMAPEDSYILQRLKVAVILIALSAPVSAQDRTSQAKSPLMPQVQHALELAKSGDRQGAMNAATHVLEQNPKFVPALKLKAMLLEESGQPFGAASTYEDALHLAPNDPDLLLKTGIAKLATGDTEQAIQLLRRCTTILPKDADAHFYLAQAYHLHGDDKLALLAIKQSLKIDPDNPSIWQKYGELQCSAGDCETGLRWLMKAQHVDVTLPRIDFDIARTNYKLMDLEAAATYAAPAADAHPGDTEALKLLATVNIKRANWPQAKSAYDKLHALNPSDVEALLGLGQCELEMKNYDSAVESLQSALRQDSTRLLAHFYLSRAYAAMGKSSDAEHEAALHQLMMQQSSFARSTENDQRESPIKAQTQLLLSAHREQEAIQLYKDHFRKTSATPADAHVFIGELYLFMGKDEDGLRHLHRALQLDPTVRGAHTYEGILALKLSDLPRAEKEFQAELAGDPSYQLAIAEMGEVRYHQKNWAEAADYLAKSKTMTPELLYMLCDSYFHLGKIEDANLNAEAAVAYAKNNPQVTQGLLQLLARNGQTDLAKRLAPNRAP